MRIRKRPPSSSSSFPFLTSLPLSPDPSLQVHPPNAKNGPAEGEGLHPVGDLPIDPHELGENPNRRPIQDPPLSDPCPDASGSRASPLPVTCERVQAVKEVKEEEEGRTVDSNKRWNDQGNRSNRISGSSGAVASGAAQLGEMISLQKKTRGGNDNGNGDGGAETNLMEKEKKAKVKARASAGPASANNNCTSGKDSDKEGCEGGASVVRAGNNGSTVNGKRRRSPSVLMEGSRCSRVNGRGWRCCQQTLVGYSLCEHHLGKGRLRSMSSVRGQLGTSKPKWSADGRKGVVPLTSTQKQQQEEEEEEEDEEKRQSPQPPVSADNGVDKMEEEEDEEDEKMTRKKRKKIGMVKARSISSLLHSVPLSLLSQAPPEVALMTPPHDNEAK